MLRRLRIAASVIFGVLTIAVIALWVRSFWYLDSWACDAPAYQHLISIRDTCQLEMENSPQPGAVPTLWRHDIVSASMISSGKSRKWIQWPKVTRGVNRTYVRIPYWTATAISAALALAPIITLVTWQKIQFTTRTLLIATTLVAIALGAIVWAAR
jgi:hypothetical protein